MAAEFLRPPLAVFLGVISMQFIVASSAFRRALKFQHAKREGTLRLK